ncbi:MAG: HIT domain-containing protein [archaeon]
MKDCIFCKISGGKVPTEKIYENKKFFSIFDIDPIVEGHALVISKEHYDTLFNLPENTGEELIDCLKKTTSKIMKRENCDGFNIVNNGFEAGGQIVGHIHFHIIPRKKDDGLKIFN